MADYTIHRPAFPGGKVYESPRVATVFAASGTGGTPASYSVQCNGLMRQCLVEIPNFTNAVTTTLTIKNRFGITIMTKSGMAKDTNHSLDATDDFDKAMVGDCTFTLALSGDAGGSGGTIYITFYLT